MKDDLISRQAAIDAVEHITSSMSVCVNTDECHGMKRMQRQAVIELANLPSAQPDLSEHSTWFRIGETLVDESKMNITAEQAVDKIRGYMIRMKKPERKKGKWVVTSEFEDCHYAKCNQCKVTQVFYYNKPLTNFCPNCGADLREGKE